jgi:hypothetical protein
MLADRSIRDEGTVPYPFLGGQHTFRQARSARL